MFTDILWRFLILETFVLGALCCSCPYKHPQEHFCKSELALLVDIHERIDLPMAKAFWIEIKKVFKGDIQKLNVTQNGSVILEMPRDCAVEWMRTEHEAFIFGRSADGRVYTNKCQGNTVRRLTSLFFRLGLKQYYKDKRNCDCDSRAIEVNRRCEWRYSAMIRSGENCEWIESNNFQVCKVFASVVQDCLTNQN